MIRTAAMCAHDVMIQEGPAAPSESWKNREYVTHRSKSIVSTLSRFQKIKSEAGAFIMWILVSEIPLPLNEIPLPLSEIPLPRSEIPLHRSGIPLRGSGIPLTRSEMQCSQNEFFNRNAGDSEETARSI